MYIYRETQYQTLQLLVLDIQSPAADTEENSYKWSSVRKQDRLHWSGMGHGQRDTSTDHPRLTHDLTGPFYVYINAIIELHFSQNTLILSLPTLDSCSKCLYKSCAIPKYTSHLFHRGPQPAAPVTHLDINSLTKAPLKRCRSLTLPVPS